MGKSDVKGGRTGSKVRSIVNKEFSARGNALRVVIMMRGVWGSCSKVMLGWVFGGG
jgi:hypothetical protein